MTSVARRAERIDIAGAVLVRDGRVLLGRRSAHKRVCPNTWDLIGGHLEPGETAPEALARELEEEVGVRPVAPRAVATWTFASGAVFSVFRVDAWTGGEPRLLGDEHTALGWFTPAEACALPDLAAPEYRDLIAELAL